MPAPDPVALDLLPDASQRLVRTVDALGDDDWQAPSGLPGWTRAHVVAHLTLNAEGLAGALGGIGAGEPATMYTSDAARDSDIEELAGASPTELRDRLLASVTAFAEALAAVPADDWSTVVERTPGGRTFVAADVASMRLREVEIHHADLASTYTSADWTAAFSVLLIESMLARADAHALLVASDLDRSWTIGDGGPAVTGTAAALGWWLTGRGDAEGLTSEGGEPPRMGEW